MVVVRILGFHRHGPGSVSGQGTKILQAAWQKEKRKKTEGTILTSEKNRI